MGKFNVRIYNVYHYKSKNETEIRNCISNMTYLSKLTTRGNELSPEDFTNSLRKKILQNGQKGLRISFDYTEDICYVNVDLLLYKDEFFDIDYIKTYLELNYELIKNEEATVNNANRLYVLKRHILPLDHLEQEKVIEDIKEALKQCKYINHKIYRHYEYYKWDYVRNLEHGVSFIVEYNNKSDIQYIIDNIHYEVYLEKDIKEKIYKETKINVNDYKLISFHRSVRNGIHDNGYNIVFSEGIDTLIFNFSESGKFSNKKI